MTEQSIEDQLVNDIIDKLDKIRILSIGIKKSDSIENMLTLSAVSDELSDVLLNFEKDPLSGSFHDLIF